jgi:hypothetical protein
MTRFLSAQQGALQREFHACKHQAQTKRTHYRSSACPRVRFFRLGRIKEYFPPNSERLWAHGLWMGYCRSGPAHDNRFLKFPKPDQLLSVSSVTPDNLLFFAAYISALGPTQLPVQWVPGERRSEYKADHSPSSSAQAKNCGDISPFLPYTFMALCLTKQTQK